MVCAPVWSIIPSLKLGDYLSVQAHKPCSISHLSAVTKTPIQSWPSYSINRKNIEGKLEIIVINIMIYSIKGKINNQSSVSDIDRTIIALGSTDNAGNSVNLVSDIFRLPSGWDVSVFIGNQ